MIIKGSTVRGKNLLRRADSYEGYCLEDVYTNPSSAKYRAYNECYRWYLDCDEPDNFRVISHNTFQFSVAWECMVEYVNPKTGEVTTEEATRIETAANTYVVLRNK